MTHLETRSPDVVGAARALLRTRRVGREFRSYQSVTSTNTLAAAWAEEGAPDGALVYAEYQTEGRGRMGRSWHAQIGLNVMFSLILRPRVAPDRLGMTAIAAGLAVAEVLERFTSPIVPAIKWPNDVLLNGRKCCGILLETRWSSAGVPSALILGIGINVNQEDFPEELEKTATSLLLETGRAAPRDQLLAAVLNQLEVRLEDVISGSRDVRQAYLGRMTQRDERVTLRFMDSGTVSGVAKGIDDSGGLLLETSDGVGVFHAGEVTHIP